MDDELNIRMTALEREISELRSDVAGLVEAWTTAGGLVKFVKWIAGLGAALFAFWAGWKHL